MDLYYAAISAPCRSVIMTAKALGVELNLKPINVSAGEQLKPEFVAINPQHTIPTLVDNGFVLWESRAILVYLVEKYGEEDNTLYSNDPQKQAVINQRLYFDMGTLYKSFADYIYPQYTQKQPADPTLFKKMEEALGFLNTFLENQEYVAGDTLTIADIAILANISTLVAIDVDLSKFPNIARWYENAKTVTPGWEENWQACQRFKDLFTQNVATKSSESAEAADALEISEPAED